MKIKTINLKIEELINISKNTLFVKNNSSPFFTFDESTCLGYQTIHYSGTDNQKYYIFLLGIKLFRCNKYHLNVIFYNKISNTVERFEPFGNDNKSNSWNIKIFIIKQICNIFNLSKSPIYYDNIQSVLKHNSTDCVFLCLKHLKILLNDLL
ncbi:hypothetical protein CDIK_4364 [Cucumispora dikerogammari]|nr:hypothetical protein CDIK_4364 [Cucumispora dikerogammari]QMS79647.1 hypothetical protein IIV6-T1_086 [Invertebrate iridescent virus 6]